ncbi:MAG: flagellar hook-basal body complex protein FliE [Deltaproteobacteria bacterium]|nr:flagellar hook-basal body complex protein FliE [Deltaproteobacteria bacterium]
MKDITLQSRLQSLQSMDPQRQRIPVGDAAPTSGPTFSDVLKKAIEDVSGLEKDADAALQQLAQGRHDNLHEAMIALQKADLSFKAMMEIRDKLISAYQEIMRMTV